MCNIFRLPYSKQPTPEELTDKIISASKPYFDISSLRKEMIESACNDSLSLTIIKKEDYTIIYELKIWGRTNIYERFEPVWR